MSASPQPPIIRVSLQDSTDGASIVQVRAMTEAACRRINKKWQEEINAGSLVDFRITIGTTKDDVDYWSIKITIQGNPKLSIPHDFHDFHFLSYEMMERAITLLIPEDMSFYANAVDFYVGWNNDSHVLRWKNAITLLSEKVPIIKLVYGEIQQSGMVAL
jgi:hypothetical protein